MELPLRLWAEGHVAKALRQADRKIYCLGHDELAIMLCSRPPCAIGVVLPEPVPPDQLRRILFGDAEDESLPPLQLIRTNSAAPRWYSTAEPPRLLPSLDAVRTVAETARGGTSTRMARTIVTDIQKYYAQQVLEPSVRGFLGILEKQFPRSDLYVFELLQNAVDELATSVTVGATSTSVTFEHNGRSFT